MNSQQLTQFLFDLREYFDSRFDSIEDRLSAIEEKLASSNEDGQEAASNPPEDVSSQKEPDSAQASLNADTGNELAEDEIMKELEKNRIYLDELKELGEWIDSRVAFDWDQYLESLKPSMQWKSKLPSNVIQLPIKSAPAIQEPVSDTEDLVEEMSPPQYDPSLPSHPLNSSRSLLYNLVNAIAAEYCYKSNPNCEEVMAILAPARSLLTGPLDSPDIHEQIELLSAGYKSFIPVAKDNFVAAVRMATDSAYREEHSLWRQDQRQKRRYRIA